jgi:hypothetical protein
MTTRRYIGTGWVVFMLEDTRGPREDEHGAELSREMPEECDVVRCECCNRRIYVVVHMRRGDESIMLGQGCAREAGYPVPPRVRAAKGKPVPVAPVAAPSAPAAPVETYPEIDASAAVRTDGVLDLCVLLDLCLAAETAGEERA